MRNLRPGLTDAVRDAHDARQHMVRRTVYDDGGPIPPPIGQVFVAPAGSGPDMSMFQPLGRLVPDGIPIEGEADHRHDIKPESFQATVTAHVPSPPLSFINLMLGIPAGWLIFQGEHSGLWWSVPDDNHCDGDLFTTYREAVDYALEKARLS